jgi:hypothetical protein
LTWPLLSSNGPFERRRLLRHLARSGWKTCTRFPGRYSALIQHTFYTASAVAKLGLEGFVTRPPKRRPNSAKNPFLVEHDLFGKPHPLFRIML